MGYIVNLKDNYIEIMKNEGVQNAIAAVIENAIAALEDEVYNSLHYDENVDFFNEVCDCLGGYECHNMCDLDDEFGRMYPTEVFETFGSDFDYTDSFYLDDMTTGNYLEDLTQENGNDCNDIATAIYNGDIYRETTSEMDEIVEEAHEMIDYLQEEAKKQEEEQKKEKVLQKFTKLVDFVAFNGTVEQVEAVTVAVWQAMMEG